MTWILVALCVIFYGSPETSSQYAIGALDPAKVWSGEVWRLVTPIFLHGNFLHLILNCIVLLQIGALLEPLIGPSRFLLAFLITGIVSFAMSLLINESIAIGSSGAVFGLVGVLMSVIALSPQRPEKKLFLRSLMWFVVLNIALGFSLNWGFSSYIAIDNVAHLSGWFTGLVIGVAIVRPFAWPGVFAILFSTVLMAIHPPEAFTDLLKGQYDRAVPRLAASHPSVLARLWSSNRRLCQIATESYKSTIDAVVWNDCAWLLLTTHDDPKLAFKWAQEAFRLSKGKVPQILHTLATAYAQIGNEEESKALIDRAMINFPPGKSP